MRSKATVPPLCLFLLPGCHWLPRMIKRIIASVTLTALKGFVDPIFFSIFWFFEFLLELQDSFKLNPDTISIRSVPLWPLGMVWGPSYEGLCVQKNSGKFSSIFHFSNFSAFSSFGTFTNTRKPNSLVWIAARIAPGMVWSSRSSSRCDWSWRWRCLGIWKSEFRRSDFRFFDVGLPLW